MFKKFLLTCFIAAVILPLTQCGPDNDFDEYLPDFPFVECTNGVSASSAIATWAIYDGYWASQDIVLSLILNADGTLNYYAMVDTIELLTDSVGWLEQFPATDNGQNQALSGIVECLERNCCSILPLIGGHYVPVFGAQGHWENNKPVADLISFNAYDAPYQSLWVNALKSTYYKPINGKFIAFLGRKKDMTDGLSDYNWFIQNDGTYYGAPLNYEPSNLPIK